MSMPSRSTADRAVEANKIIGVFQKEDFLRFAVHCRKVLRPGRHLYCFTQEKVFAENRTAFVEAGFEVRGTLQWIKKTFTKGDFKADYPIQNEMIIFAKKPDPAGRSRDLFGTIHSNVLTEFPNLSSNSMIHPTQKPVELCEYLIKRSTEEGEVVFDPFAGVGTTLIAAMQTERRSIGFELVEEFYKKGLWRINQLREMIS